MAAAIGSGTNSTGSRHPARTAESITARFSTSVIPEGTQMMMRGRTRNLCFWTLCTNSRSRSSVTSKSAITPSLSGRIAWISSGVRPSISLASLPTASTRPEPLSTATTEGSLRTMPRPRTYTNVFAVPRSMATSVEKNPIKLSRNIHASLLVGHKIDDVGRDEKRREVGRGASMSHTSFGTLAP